MRRTRRLVAMLLLLFAVAAIWIVGSNSGLRTIVGRLLPADSGIRIGEMQGSIWTGVTARDILIERNGMRLHIAEARADAALPSLVRGAVRLRRVELRTVQVTLPEVAPEDATDEVVIDLPDLRIEALAIIGIDVQRGEQQWRVDRIDTQLAMHHTKIAFNAVKLAAPAGTLDGALGFDLSLPLPLQSADLRFDALVDALAVQGALKATTAKAATRLQLLLTEPLRADLTMHDVRDLDNWSAQLDVPAQDWQKTTPIAAKLSLVARAGALAIRGDARYGTLNAPELALQARLVDDAILVLPSSLELEAPRGTITATGRLPFDATQSLDLKLHTDALEITNAAGPPLQVAGDVVVSGTRAQPSLSPELKLQRSGWPTALLSGQVARDGGSWRASPLQLVAGTSSLSLDGVLIADDNQPTELRVQLSRFDPALLLPDWPGAVDADLGWRGAWIEGAPVGLLQVDRIGGELRGRDLSGQGSIELGSQQLAATELDLGIGTSSLRLTRSDAASQFEFALVSPDLGDLVPGWRGQLQLNARGDETWEAQLDADAVDIGNLQLASGHATARFGEGADAPMEIHAQLTGLDVDARHVEKLRLDLVGTRNAHQLDIDAAFGLRQLQASVVGALDAEQAWQGQVQALDVLTPEARASLREPAALSFGSGRITLARTCIQDDSDGRACISIEHAAGSGRAALEIVALNLQPLLAMVLPQERFAARTRLSGAADVQWLKAQVVAANLRLESADGDFLVAERPDLELGFRDLVLEAHVDGAAGGWQASSKLKPEGQVESTGQLAFVDGQWQYDGSMRLNLHRFDLVEAFTSQLAAPRGDMSGELQFRGRGVAAPQWSGSLAATDFAAELPELGLELSAGALAIVAVPTGIIVRGAITSGGGQLVLDGGRGIATDAPWHFELNGENAILSDTPALRLSLSPALKLQQHEGEWRLSGRVAIPQARIDAAALAPADATSADVVIMDDAGDEAAATRMRWTADVTLAFGDDARLFGYGFDGRVRGDLRLRQRSGNNATGQGQLQVSGKYAAYGQRLTIRRGRLLFANSPLDEPTLDIEAERKAGSAAAGVRVTGSALRPQTEIYSRPALPESEALALLVTGRNIRSASGADRQRLSSAALALGTIGGDLLASNLGAEIGITGDAARGTEAFTIGKYVTPKLFIGYGLGLVRRGQVLIVRYLVRDGVELEVTSGEQSRASLNYVIER